MQLSHPSLARSFGRAAAATSLALLLAGCAVGPDFLRPAAPDNAGYTPEKLPAETASADIAGGQAQRFAGGGDIPDEWWELFRSPALDALIVQAIQANPNLDAAKAALRQAQENAAAEKGAFFPKLTGNASVTREKSSAAAFGFPGGSSIFGVSTAALNVSYPLDIFGGTRRRVESAEAQAEYQQFQLEAATVSLATNVVTAAVDEASLRAQIAATQEIVDLESQAVGVWQKQFELGGVSGAAVLAQKATLAATQAALPPLEKQLAQAHNRLAALAGRFPNEGIGAPFDLASLELPQDLPVSLPSKLVEQRPDIRSAEAQLHAASAEIGVATANMLPQISLTGSFGSTASPIGNLFNAGTGVWSIGAGLAQTLFDGGTLLHERRAAVAAYDEAAATYRGVVISAFQDVANTLRALQSDANALSADVAAERAASDSLKVARDQYQAGGITYVALLQAEQTYQQARINLVQAQANRYSDTAALFQALGGGWWNRDRVAAADTNKRTSTE